MSILAVKNEIEVELTHMCNWNCPYCAISTHVLPEITVTELFNKINTIPANSYVTLSGGEPGMLDLYTVTAIINKLQIKKCILNINTNGLFMLKYPQFLNVFNEIIYHCSENLDIDDDIIILQDKSLNIRYMLIVTDDNISKLAMFLAKYKDIKFDIVQATYDTNVDRPTLSRKNKYKLMTKFSARMTKESIQRLIHEKEWNIMKFI